MEMTLIRTRSVSQKVYLTLQNLVLFFYFAELVFPRINHFFDSTIICLICLIIWCFISILYKPSFYYNMPKRRILLLFVSLGFVLWAYLLGYPVIAHRYMSLALIYWGIIIFDFYKETNNLQELKKVLYVVLFLSFVTALTTLMALIEDPYIARSIKSSGEFSENLAKQGIGGYSFIYYLVVCAPLLLFLAIKSNKTCIRFFWLLLYLFTMFVIIKSNYLTAFITSVLTSVILVFGSLFNRGGKRHYFIFFVLILFIILFINIDFILELLPERISRVLVVEGKSVWGSIWQEFTGDRLQTLQSSWKAFLENPIFGIMGNRELGHDGEFLTGFGQHSFILDTFALYGIIGGILNLVAVFLIFGKRTYKNVNGALRIAVLSSVIIIFLFNNATESIALAIFILYPFVQHYSGAK